jgi:carboxymethylenebutenolidase
MHRRHSIMMGDRSAEYYLAVPALSRSRGVLVLHAWWGLTDFFASICDRLAAAGFVALAPDLYDGRTATTREQAQQIQSAMNSEATYALINRAIDELQAQPGIQGRPIGVVGFSLGGFLALSLDRGIAAIVTYYGTTEPDYVSADAAIMGHFAEQDEFEPLEAVRQLEQALRAKSLSIEFHIYPKTQHWFSEDNQSGYYDSVAAELAWTRTLDFLHRHLA